MLVFDTDLIQRMLWCFGHLQNALAIVFISSWLALCIVLRLSCCDPPTE